MENILRTKLFISQYSVDNLTRKRLVEKINQGIKNKVTLITAPAGFGKTTLVTEWIHQAPLPICWYSIDANDNDLIIFVSYMRAALQTLNINLGDLNLSFEQQLGNQEYQTILTPIINDLADNGQEIVLVLDDLHLITKSTIYKALCFLIEHCPPNFHLIIISRVEPEIPCTKLKVRGELVQITEDDLRFNYQEGETYLRKSFGE